MRILFSPPIAFIIYVALVGVLLLIGRFLAGSPSQKADSQLYSSGEISPATDDRSVPGYRPFFVVALFFAVLHLGVVVLATSDMSVMAIVYLLGLILILVTLILG